MFSDAVLTSSVKKVQKISKVLSSKTFSITLFTLIIIITAIILVSIYV